MDGSQLSDLFIPRVRVGRDRMREVLTGAATGVLPIFFGTVMLLFVLAVLGRPAVFPDTASYMDNGANVYRSAARVLHLLPPPKPVSAKVVKGRWIHRSFELTTMSARSPWYGLFARPLEWIGTLWLLAAVQSALAAWLIWLAWRVLAPGAAPWTAFAVQGVTATLSTLPFIAGLAMPDAFVSFMIIGVALLLVGWDRLRVAERVALAVLAALSTTFHGANALLAGAMVALVGLLAARKLLDGGALTVPVCTVICALGAGIGAGAVSDIGITLANSQAPSRPPFLAFRLIADGPGRSYLRYACAHGEHYRLCRHLNTSMNNSQAMLWSMRPREAIFSPSLPSERIAMTDEEGRFVLGTIAHDPMGVAVVVVKNWVSQLGMVSAEAPFVDQRAYLGRPELDPRPMPRTTELYAADWNDKYYRETPLPRLIGRLGDCTTNAELCRPRMTIEAARWVQRAEFLMACVALAFIVFQMLRRGVPREGAPWLRAAGLTVFALLTNALLCGAISGPFARYQSAVAWLAVMMAAIGLAAMTINPEKAEGRLCLGRDGELGSGLH